MKKFSFCLIALCLHFSLLAQENQPEMKNSGSEPNVVIYHAEEPVKNEENTGKNLLKTNLIWGFAGDINLAYERKLLDKISVEAGAGVTIRNFSKNLLVNFFEIKEVSNAFNITRQYSLGPEIMASFKYYPNGASEEFYFAPMFRYRRYNSEAKITTQRDTYKEHIGLADFLLTVGYLDYIEDNVFLEFYGGIGLRNRNQSQLEKTEDGSIQLISQNLMAPLLSIGIKIGFQTK